MVFVVFELLLVISPLCAAVDTASFSVSNQQGEGTFSSLDIAFEEVAALDDAELTLLPSLEPFSVTTLVVVSKGLWVRGEKQSVQLAEALHVAGTGHLTVSNVSLLLSDAFSSARAFDVRGTFILENSKVLGLPAPLIWLYGSARLFQVEISRSRFRTVLLKSGKAVLNLSSILASRLADSLVALSAEEFPQAVATITVTDSRFEDITCEWTFALYGGIGDIHITSSSFVRNSGLTLNLAEYGHKLMIQNCLFQDNDSSAALLRRLYQADFRIVNCTFTNNFDMIVHF